MYYNVSVLVRVTDSCVVWRFGSCGAGGDSNRGSFPRGVHGGGKVRVVAHQLRHVVRAIDRVGANAMDDTRL